MSGTMIYIFSILILLSGCFEKKSQKDYGLNSVARSEFTYRGQVERSIELKFNVEKNDVSEISAVAMLPSNYNDELSFKWSLGEGVQLASGETAGQIKKIPENKKIKLQILVKGFNSETVRHIRFEILGLNPQHRVFADGIISNQQKNSFESIVKEVENYKKENQ